MMMAQEEAILKAQTQFDEMMDFVRQASATGSSMDQVERGLWEQMLTVGRAMLEGYVAGYDTGDLGPTVEHEGRCFRRLEKLHDRRYVSVFGELAIRRTVYGTCETQKHEVVPLDALLNLPEGDFSYLLQEWDQAFCVQNSYAKSRQTVDRILGIGQSVRSLEQMNVSMAGDVEAFHEHQPTPPSEEEGSILVITADGKGVPMRRDGEKDSPARGERRKKGEKANKKRMACVGSVYTIEPFVRTADDVVNEVMRNRRQADRPVPQHKQVRAELTRMIEGEEVNGKDRIFTWFANQVAARDADGDKPVVCVMDGERALWKTLKGYVQKVVCILDLFHVMERLWQAAHCFHPEGSQDAEVFVTDRLRRILEGEVGYVMGGLRQMATKHRLRGSKASRLSEVIGYLERNRCYMHYNEYLAAGYPIGSGVAEGACRHLVKDRMELTGMRWRTEGAQAMLDLRAVYLNNDWDAFQKHRIKQERRRLYPYLRTVQREWRNAA
jgi:hypothetical protein